MNNSNVMNVPHMTVTYWLHRIVANGPSGMYDEGRPGRQLHRIGFSCTARPKHPKSASKWCQRDSKKARQIAADHVAMEHNVFAYDKSSHVL